MCVCVCAAVFTAGDAEDVLERFGGHTDTAADVLQSDDIGAIEDAATAATPLAQRWRQ